MSENDDRDRSSGSGPAGRVIAAGGAIATVHGANVARRGIIHRAKQLGNASKKVIGKGVASVPRPKFTGIRKGGAIAMVGAAAFSVGHHMVNRPYKHHLSPYNENT